MTIREWFEKSCVDRGMFSDQALQVMAMVMTNQEAMEGRWNDPIEAYPPQLLAVLAMEVDAAACDWIDANCPQAWYRPLFLRNA